MTRIALANVRPPKDRDDSLAMVLQSIKEASDNGARIVCFPECFLPGYRIGNGDQAVDQDWLDQAWRTVDEKAAECNTCVILGTERIVQDGIRITARVSNPDGTLAGFQDKVQLDPSEEPVYVPGVGRRVFECGQVTFGIVICHEGWRYPETVRWAACQGAHIVFHPHFELVEDPSFRPPTFADPCNTFHEKAALCRAAENTCYFASVNCALDGATTTSCVVDPDGTLLTHQPHGQAGLLYADIDISRANGLLAKRYQYERIHASPE